MAYFELFGNSEQLASPTTLLPCPCQTQNKKGSPKL